MPIKGSREYHERAARGTIWGSNAVFVVVFCVIVVASVAAVAFDVSRLPAPEPVGIVVDRGSSDGFYMAGRTPIKRTDRWIVVRSNDGGLHTRSIDERLWQYVRVGDSWPTRTE